MYSLLLAIIYVAFISLGLPDSLLGAAWPIMQFELRVPISSAGIITMMISAGTILSSLFSHRLTRRFGAGLVTAISVVITALAMFGFSLSTAFWQLCIWAIPYGLGAGAIDAALNNYVALHYSSRHMSWLHSFWGVGTIISPYIMGACLSGATLVLLPVAGSTLALIGFVLIGLGCAPIYPSIIHATPHNFGAANSQAVIGVEMASAYVGTTLFPPLFGLIAEHISVGLLPMYIIVITLCMLLCSELLNRKVDKKEGE